jgi:hypothetical protein
MLSCGILQCPEKAEQMRHLHIGRARSDHRLSLFIAGCGDFAGYTAWFARLNRGIRPAAEDISVLAALDAIYRSSRTGCREETDL